MLKNMKTREHLMGMSEQNEPETRLEENLEGQVGCIGTRKETRTLCD